MRVLNEKFLMRVLVFLLALLALKIDGAYAQSATEIAPPGVKRAARPTRDIVVTPNATTAASRVARPSLELATESPPLLQSGRPSVFRWNAVNRITAIENTELRVTVDGVAATADWRIGGLGAAAIAGAPIFAKASSISLGALAADESRSGVFSLMLSPGTRRVAVELLAPTGQSMRTATPGGELGGRAVFETLARAEIAVEVAAAPVDADEDGVDDALERELLARHTPYLRFSLDGVVDHYPPRDALSYVRGAELQSERKEGDGVIVANADLAADPVLLLSQGSGVLNEPRIRNDRYLNPIGDEGRTGASWEQILSQRNIGLYGHVVPFRASAPQTDFLDCVGGDSVTCSIDAAPEKPESYYKIEYWQFFPFNEKHGVDLADHEGDWASVQVIVRADSLAIAQVHHYAHGRHIAFDYRHVSSQRGAGWEDREGGAVREYRGPNYGLDVNFDWKKDILAKQRDRSASRNAQNNTLRMRRNEATGEFSHPEVYVEHCGHEFWPIDGWSFSDAQNHNGDDADHSYLAAPPPNLGEVEHPLSEAPDALLVMQYNGRWGAWGGSLAGDFINDPPQGPALHNGWTWPASSSKRWLMAKDLGN